MYDEGYKKSYNIDYARNVIHYMKQRNMRLRASMIFETMNVLDLDYEDSQFDIVFDKAVFDCVLCGIDADSKGKIFMKEVYRIIKPNGYFFLVSNSGPENRLKFLQISNIKYDIFVHKIINDKNQAEIYKDQGKNTNFMKTIHYIYVCKKVEDIKKIEVEKEEQKVVKREQIIKDEKKEEEKNEDNNKDIINKEKIINKNGSKEEIENNNEIIEENKKAIEQKDKSSKNKKIKKTKNN